MAARIDHAVSSGTFSLDGETFDVDNNVWVVGDDDECIVIDAPHSVDDILALVGDRKVKAIVCTHAHDDHVRVAPALRERVVAPIMLHPADKAAVGADPHRRPLGRRPRRRLRAHRRQVRRCGAPHARPRPGAVCLHAPDLGCVFTGDTLFHGGPGATGRSFSDAGRDRGVDPGPALRRCPDETVVHTGHGDDTTIGAERASLG